MDELSRLRRAKEGDTAAFGELLAQYQDRIFNLCRYLLGNRQDAEDAAQDAFVKAFRGLKRFEPAASFSTWLYRIAVNTCHDYRRRFFLRSLLHAPDGESVLEGLPSPAPCPETAYAARESLEALRAALTALPVKLRLVIILKELEGLPYEDMAAVLEVSVGTVKSRLFRAREELKKKMRSQGTKQGPER
ncbi:MAG: sigma-70 family RNA polymerase sigma factor [Desulfobacteraceae bacterium]|nr:sigma-70 family RNA polymerase sigma factor [Desulfobacteraceae bacterium]